MSVKAWTRVLHHSRAKGTDKLLLAAIANYADDAGEAWPSVSTLAGILNVERSSAKRARARLVNLGELTYLHQGGGTEDLKDDQRPNLYRIKVSCPPSCDGSTAHRRLAPELWTNPGASTHPGGTRAPGEGASTHRGGGRADAPQTVTTEPTVTNEGASVTGSRAPEPRCTTCGLDRADCQRRSPTSGHSYSGP